MRGFFLYLPFPFSFFYSYFALVVLPIMVKRKKKRQYSYSMLSPSWLHPLSLKYRLLSLLAYIIRVFQWAAFIDLPFSHPQTLTPSSLGSAGGAGRVPVGDVMCSEAPPEPQRPKIELVRVSSSERAKIPVNPVQLNLAYRHIRLVGAAGRGWHGRERVLFGLTGDGKSCCGRVGEFGLG